jgi:hypothetical protein
VIAGHRLLLKSGVFMEVVPAVWEEAVGARCKRGLDENLWFRAGTDRLHGHMRGYGHIPVAPCRNGIGWAYFGDDETGAHGHTGRHLNGDRRRGHAGAGVDGGGLTKLIAALITAGILWGIMEFLGWRGLVGFLIAALIYELAHKASTGKWHPGFH